MELDTYWKITLTLLMVGGTTALVGMLLDSFLGYFTKWETVVYTGAAIVFTGGVMAIVPMFVS